MPRRIVAAICLFSSEMLAIDDFGRAVMDQYSVGPARRGIRAALAVFGPSIVTILCSERVPDRRPTLIPAARHAGPT